MASYYNNPSLVDNNMYNNTNSDLDKMAKTLNDTRKMAKQNAISHKEKYEKDIYEGYNYMENNGYLLPNFSTFLSEEEHNIPHKNKKHVTFSETVSDNDSTFSPSESIVSSQFPESELSSTYSTLPHHKKKIMLSNKHLKSFENSSTSEDNILSHIKSCTQCKSELLNILKVDEQNKQNELGIEKFNENKNKLSYNIPEIKNILLVVLLGILIIIILDTFFRNKY